MPRKDFFYMKSMIFQEKMLHDFSQNPDFPAAYRGKDHLENHVTAEAPAAVVHLEAWSPMTL